LWKVGTKRILGIYSGPSAFPLRIDEDSGSPEFPANLDRIYQAHYKSEVAKGNDSAFPDSTFGDFEVCPLEPVRKGEMQAACIESTKNIFFQPYVPRY